MTAEKWESVQVDPATCPTWCDHHLPSADPPDLQWVGHWGPEREQRASDVTVEDTSVVVRPRWDTRVDGRVFDRDAPGAVELLTRDVDLSPAEARRVAAALVEAADTLEATAREARR